MLEIDLFTAAANAKLVRDCIATIDDGTMTHASVRALLVELAEAFERDAKDLEDIEKEIDAATDIFDDDISLPRL